MAEPTIPKEGSSQPNDAEQLEDLLDMKEVNEWLESDLRLAKRDLRRLQNELNLTSDGLETMINHYNDLNNRYTALEDSYHHLQMKWSNREHLCFLI